MKLRPFKRVPILVAVCVIVSVCLVQWARLGWVEKFEAMAFDWRVRFATNFPSPVATNLGFVFIDDASIAAVNSGTLGYRYGLYWPRHVYGRLVRELAAQDAKLVSFDILFAELRSDHAPVAVRTNDHPDVLEFLAEMHAGKAPYVVDDQVLTESDEFFAWQMRRAGNVALAAEHDMVPPEAFRTNAFASGDISADKDSDGILRRVRAFKLYRRWHPLFQEAAAQFDIDLREARIEPDRIVLRRTNGETVNVPIGGDGCFDVRGFLGDELPAGMAPRAKPFAEQRVWHMGIVLAAQGLNLALESANVELEQGRITLRGANGLERIIPVDAEGYFHIDWNLLPNDPRLTREPIERLLAQDNLRSAGDTNGLDNRWRDKLVVVGSSASGNDLSDRGATPLEKDTILVSKHWNVANSVLTGRFIRRSPLATDLMLITVMGVLSALLTWQLRPLPALFSVLTVTVLYVGAALLVYVQHRYWLPVFLPVVGALMMMHGLLVTWRVVFEQAERRRIKSIFARLVSPNVVNELLRAERLALGGARREITVFFADVRGFTELTDANRDRAAQFVRERNLAGEAADAVFNEQARETLSTVNLYLALAADTVKRHHGTLDKYIGDCVMAFWGAPTPNPRHALACVRAAIEAQRASHELNLQRAEENKRRENENLECATRGLPPQPLLPILMLGIGINTGVATVGLMGSDAHILNYTVFGREVNLASRLENLSGRGRIVVGETTYLEILDDDPGLAATFLALPPVMVKGIRSAVKAYEVPWRPPGPGPTEIQFGETSVGETSVTNFIKRD